MLKFLRSRRAKGSAERSPLEIRDLLEHPQLRAAMGLDPLPGTPLVSVPSRGGRIGPATSAPAPARLTTAA